MNSYELRNLQEAYLDVYQELNEDWKPVNTTRVRSRMGNLEGGLSSVSNNRISSNSPENARYQRTADLVSQSRRTPNEPFQKPKFEPGGLRIKPEGGVTSSPEKNSHWQSFSSRLPNNGNVAAPKPSGGGRSGGSSPGLVKSAPNSSMASATPNPRSSFGSNAPRPGRGSTSNWMQDRMADYTSSLKPLSKPQTKPSPRVRKGGGSSAQGVGSPSPSGTTGRFQVGSGQGYGISGIKLADCFDVFNIIKGHLLDEGYATTEEAAEVIMVNMSEGWRESICEGENENIKMNRFDKKDLRNKKFREKNPSYHFDELIDKRRVDAHDARRGVKNKKTNKR